MLFCRERRLTSLSPSGASVWTNHAVLLVRRDRFACPPDRRPIDLIGLMSLFAPPVRRTDFSSTSAWKTLLGATTSFFGSRRIFLPLLSTAPRIWIRICSSDVWLSAAAVPRMLLNDPAFWIGCAAFTRDTPSPPTNELLKARLITLAHRVSLVSISDCARWREYV